jgi:ubiquinone/menaquinone biosynthesis C-methylase UbiE
MSDIDPEIAWYYRKGREAERLAEHNQLEEARTRRIIETRLPGDALSIADVGGGPGPYSIWLAQQGHTVHLVDPIELHLQQAADAATAAGVQLAGVHHAHAQQLPFDDGQFDAMLFMGPLYHLQNRDDRVAALREALRVLRPGGLLFAAVISRYGSLVDGFFKNYVADAQFTKVMMQVIDDGKHSNPRRKDGLFTTAYFHRPEELEAELTDAGFADIELLMIEGIWSYLPDFNTRWQDEGFRDMLMAAIEKIEADRSVIGLGGHMMGVGRKRDGK